MIKKILIAALTAMVMVTGASAEMGESHHNLFEQGDMSNIRVGAVDNGNIAIGVDWMIDQTEPDAFSIGFGMGYVMYDSMNTLTQTYGSVYNLDAELKVGYNLATLTKYIPIVLKAGVGYGVTRIDTVNEWGSTYSVSAESQIYGGLGVGVEYKSIDAGGLNRVDSTIVYAMYAW